MTCPKCKSVAVVKSGETFTHVIETTGGVKVVNHRILDVWLCSKCDSVWHNPQAVKEVPKETPKEALKEAPKGKNA